MVKGTEESDGVGQLRVGFFATGHLEGLFGGDEAIALLVEEVILDGTGELEGGGEGGAGYRLHVQLL